MNVQEYISSGIIESYVLGLASAEERAEFEKHCAGYPELVAARTSFEIALEKQWMENAETPAAGVKEKLLEAIRGTEGSPQAKLVNMENTARRSGWLGLAAAAVVILLLGAAFFAYTFYTENKELQARLASNEKQMEQMTLEHQLVNDPNMAVVSMVPIEKAPPSSANIYWDSTSSTVYMVIKNMPKLPSDKQYQLWAMINGNPKSLGLFDMGNDGKLILRMDNTQKADAFAITIEKRGNTGGPTLPQLQTMGKTKL